MKIKQFLYSIYDIMLTLCPTIIFCCFINLCLSGCGHSMYHKVEGTGLYGRIPTPNGGSLIEVAIGDMNITSGILRRRRSFR